MSSMQLEPSTLDDIEHLKVACILGQVYPAQLIRDVLHAQANVSPSRHVLDLNALSLKLLKAGPCHYYHVLPINIMAAHNPKSMTILQIHSPHIQKWRPGCQIHKACTCIL